MTKPNPFLWPKGTTIIVCDRYGEICSSKDRRFDLADAIMLRATTNQKTVTISFILDDWSAELDQRLEQMIRYDLEFDGHRVNLTPQEPVHMFESCEWKVTIKPA